MNFVNALRDTHVHGNVHFGRSSGYAVYENPKFDVSHLQMSSDVSTMALPIFCFSSPTCTLNGEGMHPRLL